MVAVALALFAAWGGSSLGCFAIGLLGFPGALLAGLNRQSPRWWIGYLLCVIGQGYVALVWAGFLSIFARANQASAGWLGWVLWIICFYAAVSPSAMAARSVHQEMREDPEWAYKEENRNNAQYSALTVTCWLDALGFIVFAVWPSTFHPITPWMHWKG